MSQRILIVLIGILASGLALLGRFGRVFENWDAGVLSRLSLPAGSGAMPPGVEALCTILFAFGTSIVGLQVVDSKFRTGLFCAILLQPVSAMAVGHLAGIWVSPFAYLTAIVAALAGIFAYRFSAAGKRQRQIREIFGRHLSEKSLAQLLARPDVLELKNSPITVVSARYLGDDWSQVESFAAQLREQSAWVELQTDNRILAVWNLPLEQSAFAVEAVAAALQMTGDWQIGVATGDATAEWLPTVNRWQIRGGVFEKAATLCPANVSFGSKILADLTTADLVRDAIMLRPVDFLVLPGSDMAVETFEPLSFLKSASDEAIAQRDRFWEAVIFFRQKRFVEAMNAFEKSGDDPVVTYYRKRLDQAS